MTELVIWGRLNSINVQKVLWVCQELQLPFQRKDAGMEFGVNNTPEFLKINPNGLVPLLQDESFDLWESHAIMRYLARKKDVSGQVYPSNIQKAARVDQWLDWYTTVGWPPMRGLFWGWIRTPEKDRNEVDLEKLRQQMIRVLTIVDEQLKTTKFIAGDQFTLADIPLALLAYRWFNLPIDRPALAHLEQWYQQVSSRPGFQKYSSGPLT